MFVASSLLLACGQSPEELLAKQWVETSWKFEKLDESPQELRRFDGIRIQAFEKHEFFRHESEYWRFYPDHRFEIALEDGRRQLGRWRLKGRGHVLTLRYEHGEVEAYDIKELSPSQLVLHVHLGMEVRGIARLTFSEAADESSTSNQT